VSSIPGDSTAQLIEHWRVGDDAAGKEVFDRIYQELRVVAHNQLRRVGRGTLDTTALVHETYLKLVPASLRPQDRAHVFALAAIAMRQILTDFARHRLAEKRGGGLIQTTLDDVHAAQGDRSVDVLAVNQALESLERADPRLGRLVELRYFGGMSIPEIATVLEVSERTVLRDWKKARAFLYQFLETESSEKPPGRVP
jgi:RNA polymerase sigma factor (TIGR02999 family)